MRSFWGLLLCALFALKVLAESEYVHAKEMIYFYTNYLLERDVYDASDRWIDQCKDCGFNKFIYYLETGRQSGWPMYIETNGRLDPTDNTRVEAAIQKMLANGVGQDDTVPKRVIRSARGFNGLYDSMQAIYEYAEQQANRQGAPASAKTAFDKWGPKLKQQRDEINVLRKGTSQSKLRDELKTVFPNDQRYAVYDKPGGGKYDVVNFKDATMTGGSKSYTVVDIPGTEALNKELQPGGGLRTKWQERINMFWRDDINLVNRNPNSPRANRGHLAVTVKIDTIVARC
ncbi:hypothetical protein F5X68DRAFT_234471 [Plectosphaerella plurivora]|uniref:Uncharacterized protein n=1 Tax=Plectosphaerella plurivora TaxID=936078 RepID=A0A9P9A9T5_9PEZI|nr:hypothetical protein F5X68DRAFT_234471 [Plectosphaerella plurivora]